MRTTRSAAMASAHAHAPLSARRVWRSGPRQRRGSTQCQPCAGAPPERSLDWSLPRRGSATRARPGRSARCLCRGMPRLATHVSCHRLSSLPRNSPAFVGWRLQRPARQLGREYAWATRPWFLRIRRRHGPSPAADRAPAAAPSKDRGVRLEAQRRRVGERRPVDLGRRSARAVGAGPRGPRHRRTTTRQRAGRPSSRRHCWATSCRGRPW